MGGQRGGGALISGSASDSVRDSVSVSDSVSDGASVNVIATGIVNAIVNEYTNENVNEYTNDYEYGRGRGSAGAQSILTPKTRDLRRSLRKRTAGALSAREPIPATLGATRSNVSKTWHTLGTKLRDVGRNSAAGIVAITGTSWGASSATLARPARS